MDKVSFSFFFPNKCVYRAQEIPFSIHITDELERLSDKSEKVNTVGKVIAKYCAIVPALVTSHSLCRSESSCTKHQKIRLVR